MPDMPFTAPEYYRREAERNRNLASHAKGVFQRELLKLAAEYEELAKETENHGGRLRRWPSKNNKDSG